MGVNRFLATCQEHLTTCLCPLALLADDHPTRGDGGSRGAHFRADYPELAVAWAQPSLWTLKALESKKAGILRQALAI